MELEEDSGPHLTLEVTKRRSFTVLYCTALYCAIMIINCTVLCCTVLYYAKRRSLTRRPTAFSDCEAVVTGEVAPDRSLEAEYITRVRRAV